MVDFREVQRVLAKGVFGAVGLMGSATVGNVFARQDGADAVGAAGNIAVGAALDIFDEELGIDMDLLGVTATEYIGVGMQSAGWREAGQVVGIDLGSLQSTQKVVDVTERESSSSSGSSGTSKASVGSF